MLTINFMIMRKIEKQEIEMHHPLPYKCLRCYDTGVYIIADGPDDYAWEQCGLCEKSPIENAEIEFINRAPDSPDEEHRSGKHQRR